MFPDNKEKLKIILSSLVRLELQAEEKWGRCTLLMET